MTNLGRSRPEGGENYKLLAAIVAITSIAGHPIITHPEAKFFARSGDIADAWPTFPNGRKNIKDQIRFFLRRRPTKWF